MTQQILDALKAYEVNSNKAFVARFGEDHPTRKLYEIQVGRVYTRVVCRDLWVETNSINGGSAHMFIKNDDLTIWKAASWKAPAKNKPRGVLADLYDMKKAEDWLHGI